MISLAEHPASASRRHAAFRSPCGLQRFGKPAASHQFRNCSLKIAAVGLAGRGGQKRQVFARRGVEHRLQVWMHRDRERPAGFFLLHREHSVLDVLATYLHDIAATLCGVQQYARRGLVPI